MPLRDSHKQSLELGLWIWCLADAGKQRWGHTEGTGSWVYGIMEWSPQAEQTLQGWGKAGRYWRFFRVLLWVLWFDMV